MTQEAYLGIDLGTSAAKVLILDGHGIVLSRASRSYSTHAPKPGWAEQSPSDWWAAVCAATKEAINKANKTIVSVGLSGQLNGVVLLDAQGKPLGNAIIWLDIRAVSQAKEFARMRDFVSLTGNAISPICVLPKLAWLQENRRDLMAQTKRIALAKDYVLLRLTGNLATDPSDALSTAMTEIGGTAWSPDLTSLASLDTEFLPKIEQSATIAGRITANAATETGLAPSTPVATGAGDVAALAVGCGIVNENRIAITLGTAGHVVSQAKSKKLIKNVGLWQLPHAVAERQLWLGLIMSGGLSLSWLKSILSFPQPLEYEQLNTLASEVQAGSEGAFFLPFLEGAATPYSRPDVRGAFLGLSSAHSTGHLIRAVMEGVAYNARQCVEAMVEAGVNNMEIHLAEGGAQSPTWCQSIADVLGQPVHLIAERDTSASGAALLGRSAATGISVPEAAENSVVIDRVFEPNVKSSQVLNSAYLEYLDHCDKIIDANSLK